MLMLRKKVPSYSRTEEMSVRRSFVPDRHGLSSKGERGKIMNRDEILAELDNLLKDSTYEELSFYLELVQRMREKEQDQATTGKTGD